MDNRISGSLTSRTLKKQEESIWQKKAQLYCYVVQLFSLSDHSISRYCGVFDLWSPYQLLLSFLCDGGGSADRLT